MFRSSESIKFKIAWAQPLYVQCFTRKINELLIARNKTVIRLLCRGRLRTFSSRKMCPR